MIKSIHKSTLLVLSATFAICAANVAAAAGVGQRLDQIGGNKALMKKAKAVSGENRFRVVQKRAVDRHNRLEIGMNYGLYAGGDAYINTQSIGGAVDFHFTPRWSLGVRYFSHTNQLTPEGKRIHDDAENNPNGPWETYAVDFPLSTTLGVVSFYPLYGKINWFDAATSQFDIYVLAGAGQMKLRSGSSPTWTAGGGVGLWLTQNISSRLEVRYQSYEDQIYSGARQQDLVVSTFSVGILL